jgi:chemotaxis protein MotB
MKQIFSLLFIALFTFSCVSSKKFKSVRAELEDYKVALEKCKENQIACEQEKKQLMGDYSSKFGNLENEHSSDLLKIKSLEEQLDFIKRTNTNLLDRLSDLSVVSVTGAENIKRSLDAINEKDKQISTMTTNIQRKDSVNLALVMNLKRSLSDVPSDDINIEVKKGVVYISLSDKMLYKSGSAVINDQANSVLEKIAKVVNDHYELEILVEGHTDNIPISSECMADNWDLSTKRATAVVRVLQNKYKVNPSRMTAGGRSEFVPKSDNATIEGRKINRRTEIIILPKLDQFFKLLESK